MCGGRELNIRNQSDLPKIAKAKLELENTLRDIRKELGLTNDHKPEKVTITRILRQLIKKPTKTTYSA